MTYAKEIFRNSIKIHNLHQSRQIVIENIVISPNFKVNDTHLILSFQNKYKKNTLKYILNLILSLALRFLLLFYDFNRLIIKYINNNDMKKFNTKFKK